MSNHASISDHAAAAKQIRKFIKKMGLKAQVKAQTASMTSSVRVVLQNATPLQVKQVSAFAKQFQYGHFDGMNDIYENSNVIKDLPQVKFVFVRSDYDETFKQKALDAITKYFNIETLTYGNHDSASIINHRGLKEDMDVIIHRTLGGVSGYLTVPFWEESDLPT